MRTLRAAAALLEAAESIDHLEPIARALGAGASLPLDPVARNALGLNDDVTGARVAPGRGALRVLLLQCAVSDTPRDVTARIARRLAARAPHQLWLIALAFPQRRVVGLAAWSGDPSRPRIAALLTERSAIADSDAETLRAMAVASTGMDDLATHVRWVELLGRDGLTRRFYRALAAAIEELAMQARGRAALEQRRELALLYASRLLFLAFLEAKGWLDGDRGFLSRSFHEAATKGGVHHRLLLPLFFGTLNTPARARAPAARALGRIPFLNGGLFSRIPLERQHRDVRFQDESLGRLFGDVLARHRFTAHEDSASFSDAAVDPEMLGRAFESLMVSDERRASGSFYTPHALVERAADAALLPILAATTGEEHAISAAFGGEGIVAALPSSLRDRVAQIRILDPACGSGAFLVHCLERLSRLSQLCGDRDDPGAARRAILARSIFGVDRSPMAVWLCELRLWLATVIDTEEADPMRVPPLPNLDHHILVGDALAGGDFSATISLAGGVRLAAMRRRYAAAVGHRKGTLARALEREERRFALSTVRHAIERTAAARRDLLTAVRSRDLFGGRSIIDRASRARLGALRAESRAQHAHERSLRAGGALPFSFGAHFPDVGAAGGFDVVVGNPPWVRLHRIPKPQRAALKRDFRVYREAAWVDGAERAGAGTGFAAQVDLAALFAERSVSLLRSGGVMSLLLPSKLWRSLAGGGVRRLLLDRTALLSVDDWSAAPALFDAATYPSLVVARAGDRSAASCTRVAIHRAHHPLEWAIDRHELPLDASPGAPWILLPRAARVAFDRLARAGPSLSQSDLGRPTLGVKCGCNEAFVVSIGAARSGNGVTQVMSGERSGVVEKTLLLPVLRGEQVGPWKADTGRDQIIWTHGDDGRPLPALPPFAARWFSAWRSELEHRADARGAARWWSLFRTEAASFATPRVVWSDFGRSPRALVLDRGDRTVPLNTCYVLACADRADALAFAALLNSPIAAAWLAVLAEPARGGYHRYLAWTVALLPVPANWPRAREILAPLGEHATAGAPPRPLALSRAVCRAFRVRESDIAPLLEWTHG